VKGPTLTTGVVAALLVVLALVAGCGGGSSTVTTGASRAASDAAIRKLLDLRQGNAGGRMGVVPRGVVITPKQAERVLHEMREQKGSDGKGAIAKLLEKLRASR
jgi:hypothetical protein